MGTEEVCGRPGAEPGAIVLRNLRAEWVTPNHARLEWDAEGLEELFAYEVDVAESEAALLAGDLLWTVTDGENPELARSRLLNASGADEVLGTTLRGLDPDTTYRVRLVAEDRTGKVSCSETVGVRTNPAATDGVQMVDESEDGASTMPPCVSLDTGADSAASGERYWQWIARCETVETVDGESGVPVCATPAEPHPTCWENLRFESLDYPLSLNEGQFQRAFLEMWVAVEDSEHGYWGELGVSTPRPLDPTQQLFFTTVRITIASNVGYRLYQIPLRSMRSMGRAMTLEDANEGIRSFRVGTQWNHDAVVRVDGAAIRW